MKKWKGKSVKNVKRREEKRRRNWKHRIRINRNRKRNGSGMWPLFGVAVAEICDL
jgi:hypothetical protein